MTRADSSDRRSALAAVQGVVLDMDGVLWRGTEALPGVPEFFAALASRGVPFALATNNSGASTAAYVELLRGHGVPDVDERHVITSATVTTEYLCSTYARGARVHVLGSQALADVIASAGFLVSTGVSSGVSSGASSGMAALSETRATRVPAAAAVHGRVPAVPADTAGSPALAVAAVVVGIDLDLTYAKLARAAELIHAGADFIGTNGDPSLPTETGSAPGTGSILAALRAATGRDPRLIGKPGPLMFASAARTLSARPEHTLMVGDRLDTDIVGARRFGMQTALVLTGVTTAEDAQHSTVPTGPTYRDLRELLEVRFGT